jgi:hypothetical protein
MTKPSQTQLAEKAAALKHAAPDAPRPAPEQTANQGMAAKTRPGQAPSGAFDAEGQRPVLERSRKVR